MKLTLLAVFSITILGATSIPNVHRDSNYLTLRSLHENDRRYRSFTDPAYNYPIQRRLALAKGGGGKTGTIKKGGKGGGSSGGSNNPPPPGLSPDGLKAFNECTAAQNSQGDCGAMIGPFAETGCSLGSIHSMKPCENKEVQAALSKQYCSKNPGGKFCK